eukprot:9479911-Pyramimonas_sp.AAC.1
MVLLGVLVTPDPLAGRVHVQIDEAKAHKWSLILEEILASNRCTPAESSKMAGRLSFTCCTAADKVGRAYIAPFHAQQHDPLPDFCISGRFRRAAA